MEELKELIHEAEEEVKKDINLKEITKESLANLIPELKEFEIKFWGECSGEVGGEIDYVYGGIKNTFNATEDDTGYITLEHPFVKEGDEYVTKEDWQISCSWSTDFFDVSEKQKVETIEDVYKFILDIQVYFDDFELQTIWM